MFRRRAFAVLAAAMVLTLALAPAASAATSASGINVIVPGGGKITGTVKTKDTSVAIASRQITATPVSGGAQHTALTNASGAFTLAGLVIGQPYILQVAGSASYPAGFYASNADHFTQLAGSAAPTPAATAAGVSAGTILVAKGLSINGVVKGGTTASNIPLASITVRLSGRSYNGFDDRTTLTSSTGAYSFSGLPTGTYGLSFETPDFSSYVSGVYQANGTGNWASSSPSTITLNSASVAVGTILPAGKLVSGVVKDQAGVAIEGAQVVFSPMGEDWSSGSRTAATNAAGAYVIRGVGANTSGTLRVDPGNGVNLWGYYRTGAAGNFIAASYGTSGTAVVVGAANVTVPEIRAALPFSVTGYVRSTAGTGLADVSVSGLDDYTYTDSTGKYVLRVGPSSGSICVWPDVTNVQGGCFREGMTGNFTGATDLASNVVALAAKSVGEIKLPAGSKITGVVQLPSGAAAGDARVEAIRACGTEWCEGARGYADETGAFSIVGLWPGTYALRVSAPYSSGIVGGWFDAGTPTTHLALVQSSADSKTFGTTASTWAVGTVRLVTGFSISGTVKAGTTASPVPLAGATVTALPTGGGYGGIVTGSQAAGSKTPVGIKGTVTTAVKGGAITAGADKSGEATAPSAAVTPSDTTGGYMSVTTSATGFYSLTGLEPGWYMVSVTPTASQNYETGYRMAGVAPNYSRASEMAQFVCVGPACP
jgi:hypothetical protein